MGYRVPMFYGDRAGPSRLEKVIVVVAIALNIATFVVGGIIAFG